MFSSNQPRSSANMTNVLAGSIGRGAVIGLALMSLTHAAHANGAKAEPQIPVCDHTLGTLAIQEPQNQWWVQLNLDSPEALIKVIVSQSHCFKLVDRGRGLDAAQNERELSADGDLAAKSNIGKGQMKAADYILVPDVASRNNNSAATAVGGQIASTFLSKFVPMGLGSVLSGISLKSKTADVALTLTDTRSTEQVALEQGHARKMDLAWDAGGAGLAGAFAAAGAGSYTNTEMGKVVTQAYIDAYTKMVADVRQLSGHASTNNAPQGIKTLAFGKLYASPDLKSQVVRNLDSGMMLYPTGDRMADWSKASDELGNEGWVQSKLIALANQVSSAQR